MRYRAKRRMGPDGKASHVVLHYNEGTDRAFTVLLYWNDYQRLRKLKLRDGAMALESVVLDEAGNPCLPNDDAANGLVPECSRHSLTPLAGRWLDEAMVHG